MRKFVLAAAMAVAAGFMDDVWAQQQPANPPAQGAPQGGRRGGPPGGGPETGMNTRPPNGTGQQAAFAGQTRAPEQKLGVPFDVVTLVRLTLEGERVIGEERLLQDLQPQRERIRDVRQGPDGALYFLTDSAQGRLMKLVPKQ